MRKKSIVVAMALALALTTGCVPDQFRFEKEIGKSGTGKGQYLSANDLELTKSGDVIVADAGNLRYQVISPAGTVKLISGDKGKMGYKLLSISGIGSNPLTNDLWVCDQRANKILRFNPSGVPTLKITKGLHYPMDVALDKQGNAYVLMSKKPHVYVLNSRGKLVKKIGGSGKTALIFGTSIIIKDKSLYIADYGGKRILKMSTSGKFEAEFKSKGDYEEMKGPSAVHVDDKDNMYVLDLGEVPVVVLSPKGELISKIGDFGNEKGKFLYPRGIIAKSDEEILVLDNSRNCILNFKKKPE